MLSQNSRPEGLDMFLRWINSKEGGEESDSLSKSPH